jgi:hypothetical protein
MNPADWPEGEELSDDQALVVATLILDQKPKSYVEGARRLAKYVISLHTQAKEIEELIDEERRDTERRIPIIVP